VEDFRFTINPTTSTLYVVAMGAKPGDSITVKSLGASRVVTGTISGVRVLGASGNAPWSVDSSGLHVQLPSSISIPPGLPPVIAVAGLTDLQWDGLVRQGQDNSINFLASLADKFIGGVQLSVAGEYVTTSNWKTTSDAVQWTAKVRLGGTFKVNILSACPDKSRVAKFSSQGKSVVVNIPQTGNSTTFALTTGGTIFLTAGIAVSFSFQLPTVDITSDDPVGFQLAYVQLVAQN